MLRRSWVEINLSTIAGNYRVYKSHIPESQEIMAVVKADAYGHGEDAVVRTLQKEGCRNYAVSNIEEAKKVRAAGADGQVLVLGYTPTECADELKEYDITQAILSEEYAEALAGRGIKAQVAIETGMNRIGLDADDPCLAASKIRKYASEFDLTGIFTHFCAADTPSENDFTLTQAESFRKVAEEVKDLDLPYVHMANSAGGLWQESYGNLVRLGIIMYGLKPDAANTLPEGIRPALSWKSVVSMTRKVLRGETIGYGRSFEAPRDMTIAIVPTGYADGFQRSLSNKGHVVINGTLAPIVGRVCMDQLMVDVSDIGGIRFGDEVTLIGGPYTADDMAREGGTIGYEIVCGISKRVPKTYL